MMRGVEWRTAALLPPTTQADILFVGDATFFYSTQAIVLVLAIFVVIRESPHKRNQQHTLSFHSRITIIRESRCLNPRATVSFPFYLAAKCHRLAHSLQYRCSRRMTTHCPLLRNRARVIDLQCPRQHAPEHTKKPCSEQRVCLTLCFTTDRYTLRLNCSLSLYWQQITWYLFLAFFSKRESEVDAKIDTSRLTTPLLRKERGGRWCHVLH